MEKNFVTFEGSISRYGDSGVNYMLTCIDTDDGILELYAEIDLPEDIEDEYGERIPAVSEDYGYISLKSAILDLAQQHGIVSDAFRFWYDDETGLSDDAFVRHSVSSDWRYL